MFEYTISFKGKNFDAVNCFATTKLHVEKVFNAGETKQKIAGNYDFGYLRLSGEDLASMLEEVSDLYTQHKGYIDEVEVEVTYFYGNQCNLEFSKNEIDALNKLEANLSITCVKE
ncbi:MULTISPECIES: hypothetical protein [unclassified Alteromonas]|uniref:hypothetical protein n=1 Tax=unclassified Alteromonas TaxID=2614992 RepID=UPI000B71CA16|nr:MULTISPECIES: hypothetical protein [unclassified Alteromonas]MAI37191.1 hypothetical protein [Alteromonas sp.]OUX89434.1 MAG: hypothetical protein CBB95_06015 [Alteromonas sp. TMED35]|tara:strand:+ start:23554 stop:23898 length:345 start_codon:yes stop_codon:yes gene_type:complete